MEPTRPRQRVTAYGERVLSCHARQKQVGFSLSKEKRLWNIIDLNEAYARATTASGQDGGVSSGCQRSKDA